MFLFGNNQKQQQKNEQQKHEQQQKRKLGKIIPDMKQEFQVFDARFLETIKIQIFELEQMEEGQGRIQKQYKKQLPQTIKYNELYDDRGPEFSFDDVFEKV